MKTLAYGIIQAIKKNDCLNNQLSELEKIMDQIYDRYTETNSQTYRKCIFPEDTEPEDFFETIYQFIEKSQLKLQNDSKELLTQKPTK